MSCKHVELATCKLKGLGRCIFVTPDENRCSEDESGIIHYLKALGTYNKFENNHNYIGGRGMYNAKEMRKVAEQVRDTRANDYYYNTLDKKIFERIKKTAETGSTILTITFTDEMNREDRWMDNPGILAILKEELEKLGYEYKYTPDRDNDWITISW